MRYPEKVECWPDRILPPGGMSYVAHRKGDRLRVQGVGTPPPDDTECASLSGATPSGFPKKTRGVFPYPDSSRRSTRHSRSSHPDDSISYQDVLSGSLTKVHKPCYVIRTACHNPYSAALRWCVRTPCLDILWIPKNSPQSRIALVIKKLLKHQNLTQFD